MAWDWLAMSARHCSVEVETPSLIPIPIPMTDYASSSEV